MTTDRIEALERRVRRLDRTAWGGWGAAGLMAAVIAGGMGTRADDELRVRRLIVEDEEGRARIVLAAPITELEGRVRADPATGLLLLDENGIDRVVVGSPTTSPQIRGELARRIGPASGINFNDASGDERGGLGVLDNDGRAVLGLDREGGEGVALFVTPDYAGLMVNGGAGGGHNQRVFIGTSAETDTAVFNMDDASTRRMQITVPPEGGARLELYDEQMEPILTLPEGGD
jgi:hypothetical protein